jgi:hypothetical protein
MHRAYEYLQQCKDKPSVWYDVEVSRGPKSGATQRGVYLRETHDCQRASEVYICGNMLEKALKAWEISP